MWGRCDREGCGEGVTGKGKEGVTGKGKTGQEGRWHPGTRLLRLGKSKSANEVPSSAVLTARDTLGVFLQRAWSEVSPSPEAFSLLHALGSRSRAGREIRSDVGTWKRPFSVSKHSSRGDGRRGGGAALSLWFLSAALSDVGRDAGEEEEKDGGG